MIRQPIHLKFKLHFVAFIAVIAFITSGFASESIVNVHKFSEDAMRVTYSAPMNELASDNLSESTPKVRFVAVPKGSQVSISKLNLTTQNVASMNIADFDDELLLNEAVSLGSAFNIGEVDLIPVIINPYTIGKDNTVQRIKQADFDLTLPQSDTKATLRKSVRNMLGDMLINDAPRRDAEGEAGGAYVFVIPNDNRINEIIAPLITYRERQGYRVKVLTLPLFGDGNWIYNELKQLDELGPEIEYICLVGDAGGEFNIPGMIQNTTDFHYTLLVPNSPIPAASIGRLSYNSINELRNIVNKILNYEQNQNPNEMDWTKRGAVVSGSELSGYSTILVNKWVRSEMLANGFAEVDTFWYTMGRGVGSFLENQFNRGVGFVNHRGWTGIEDWSPRAAGLLDNRHLPVSIFLGCNTADFDGQGAGYTEALLRASGGSIAAIGSVGSQSRVGHNNALLAGFYRGVLNNDVERVGDMLNRAIIEMYAIYQHYGREIAVNHAYWTNLMGDPATVIWRDAPRIVNIEAPQQVAIGNDGFNVTVRSGGQPLEGVQVAISKTGQLSQYAYTNAEGVARLTIPFGNINPGPGFITVSGGGVQPSNRQITITTPANFFAFQSVFVVDDQQMPRNGNFNGIANPFEVVELNITLRMIGTNAVVNPTQFTLSTDHRAVNIRENVFQRQQIIAPNDFVNVKFLIEMTEWLQHRDPIPFNIAVVSGNLNWNVQFDLLGGAPRWSIHQIVANAPFSRNQQYDIDIYLINDGAFDFGISAGRLHSDDEYIQILNPGGIYDTLRVNEVEVPNTPYRIGVSNNAPYGGNANFRLELEDESGLMGEIFFTVPLSDLPNSEVTGPDAYGYYAIDWLDTTSNIKPIFNYVNLSPTLNGQGTSLGMVDRGEDDDKTTVLDLPFTFKYYGQDFDQISISTNGWAAFGDQRQHVDFRNLPIGAPQTPKALIAPWWDDLYQPDAEGEVFYWYDQNQKRLIIEWFRMSRYIGRQLPGAKQTFQMILLDPKWHPNTTGDGDIIFQYSSIVNEQRIDVNGTPYSTIGIGNLEGDGGLQYSFLNRWSSGSSPVTAGSAVRFATSASRPYGIFKGRVTSALENQPIPNAVIRTSKGGWTTTDVDGNFRLTNALANVQLNLEVMADGFNTAILEGRQVNANDSVDVIIMLTSPSIALNVEAIEDTILAGIEAFYNFNINNEGNGDLEVEFSVGLGEENDDIELWTEEDNWNISQMVNDNRILGVTFLNDFLYISGGNNGNMNNYIYVYDRNRFVVNRINQPVQGLWGFHDLSTDGEFLYGGTENSIYVMNTFGQVVRRFDSPVTPARAIAVNPENGDIWVTNVGAHLYRLDSQGNVLDVIPHSLRPYGMSWFPNDPDGIPLYIFSQDGASNMAVSKFDVRTHLYYPVTEFDGAEGSRAGGIHFTHLWDTKKWVAISVIQHPNGDNLSFRYVGVNTTWLSFNPVETVIQPNQQLVVNVIVNAQSLRDGDYFADIVIKHNATGGETRLPIRLHVEPQVVSADSSIPLDYHVSEAFPNPFNPTTTLSISLLKQSTVKGTLYDISGRIVSQVFEGELLAGKHNIAIDGNSLSGGLYFLKVEINYNTYTRKVLLLK